MSSLDRLKQFFKGNGEARGLYTCLACHEQFERQPQVCPECGGYDIRRAEWIDGEKAGTDE
jgi:rRNA maturation endonuclease Nob1